MSDCKQIVRNFIIDNELIGGEETVIAGVSGGADSVCLFHLLRELSEELNFSIRVVHINHMIRDTAAADENFVKNLCEKYGIPFYIKHIDIPRLTEESGQSEEEVGRNERYKAFLEVAAEADGKALIATAHNRNDLSETMLHNLFRGSRLTGLAGIRPWRMRDGYKLIRPILILDRAEIEKYLTENGYTWCTDETNLEDDYTRNRIRHHILPYAEKEINKSAIKHVAEAASYLAEVDDYLDEQARKAGIRIEKESENEIVYDLSEFRKEPAIIRKRLIMRSLKTLMPGIKDVTATHLEEIDKLAEDSRGSGFLSLPYGIRIVRNYDRLFIRLPQRDIQSDGKSGRSDVFEPDMKTLERDGIFTMKIPGLGTVTFRLDKYDRGAKIPDGEYTKWFDYDKIHLCMQFRRRREGDLIEIGNGRKSLKKFMIDEKIPADIRNDIYLLMDGDITVWVPFYRIGSGYKVDDTTDRFLEVTLIPDNIIYSPEK
ncbi:MAG: tRNA lysidine(34) synthetase TilS [Butyrivibrio sp.]|nr:tRNA lysidine(34) synthetase TilS [Butyrivibrio sp.]